MQYVYLQGNNLRELPASFAKLQKLTYLGLGDSRSSNPELKSLPINIGDLKNLSALNANNCGLISIPYSITNLKKLKHLNLEGNPFSQEIMEAYNDGWDSLKSYLELESSEKIVLNEGKLILIGEGEVGKTSLLAALRDDEFVENRPTTHGIEILPVQITHKDSGDRNYSKWMGFWGPKSV